jgi:hypothetical protein
MFQIVAQNVRGVGIMADYIRNASSVIMNGSPLLILPIRVQNAIQVNGIGKKK